MKKMISICVAVALTGLLIYGITFQEKVMPSEQPGRVITTTAYEKYFGAAPFVDKGTAFAFVIYFPSKKEPGKVVPFPFFTFDEGSLKKVSVERLLGSMDTGSYRGEFLSFPGGTHLIGVKDDNGTIVVNLSKELGALSEVGLAHAVSLTLRQFNGVKDVKFQVDGKESPLNSLGESSDDNAVQQPSPPRLLSVTAIRDKGAENIEDVNVFFDRPVEVKELQLLSKDGQPFAGDIYHSVFDMAAVLKPKDPSSFKEHMPITVRWKVVDKLGRQSEGEKIWSLEVKEH